MNAQSPITALQNTATDLVSVLKTLSASSADVISLQAICTDEADFEVAAFVRDDSFASKASKWLSEPCNVGADKVGYIGPDGKWVDMTNILSVPFVALFTSAWDVDEWAQTYRAHKSEEELFEEHPWLTGTIGQSRAWEACAAAADALDGGPAFTGFNGDWDARSQFAQHNTLNNAQQGTALRGVA